MSNDHKNNTQAASPITPETTIPFWRQVRWTLVITFVLIAIIPLFIVVTLIVDRINTQVHDQIIRQLESVAELKSDQITRWLENSRSTLNLVATHEATRDQVTLLLQQAPSIDDERQLGQNPVNAVLTDAVEAQDQFEEFFLFETDGRIIASSNLAQLGKLVTAQPYFEASIAGEVIQSPYYELG
ncbi:MAG: hypothetical protein R3264_13845, partial [Anaerolineae bacterium]|nr:hypothetical protein [Anaerolineae bacterium]